MHELWLNGRQVSHDELELASEGFDLEVFDFDLVSVLDHEKRQLGIHIQVGCV